MDIEKQQFLEELRTSQKEALQALTSIQVDLAENKITLHHVSKLLEKHEKEIDILKSSIDKAKGISYVATIIVIINIILPFIKLKP